MRGSIVSARRRYAGLVFLLVAALATAAATAASRSFSAADVYRSASPSVVMIYAKLDGKTSSTGTGSVVSSRGLVLTNNHVISTERGRASSEIAIFFKPSRVTGDLKADLRQGYRAKVLARNAELDLALLQVEGAPPSLLKALAFGNSEQVEVGQSVAAIGHPSGGGLWTLTTGTISSTRKRGELDVFQTDTAINPGNSGGPLLDGQARLIGVNTFVVRVSDTGLPLEGLNYSLRGNLVQSWLSQHGVQVAVAERRVAEAAPPPRRAEEPPATRVEEPPRTARPAAPARPAPEPAPKPPAQKPPTSRTPPAKDEPRAFTGPQGEEMFGVPNRSFTQKKLKNALYRKAQEHARDAFDELEGEF